MEKLEKYGSNSRHRINLADLLIRVDLMLNLLWFYDYDRDYHQDWRTRGLASEG